MITLRRRLRTWAQVGFIAESIVVGGCFVPSVDIAGKACDLQNSCDVGYCCVPYGSSSCGAPLPLAMDAGFVCLPDGKD